ncbi:MULTISPECIES: Stk1 family PASTA domain-containing Ser/Thr kinase [unclassified Streptomyces]|uniref:Stk1 family PASTA domain-containing Ser/Thr kinase n=1 Tax=unclassified Streptomyces TaxID=2593676 RepID=UPI0016610CDB|nr:MULTISPECIES: Stk1 family PASTA domain-containing Ser/Thr kinase [unclassified Streptomyces]MBD0708343.1 serine/threonine protein kinase [Streptomyces sp. CBMA291]MBD0708906.1 serine/threonine protein kinase [Streptomyces sp. CBMA291]MBD0716436.1 serine/threonine protein kinase [Streptomyces sp. CBMA370]
MEEPRRLGGRYELGSVLGRGGMAEVYLGQDTRLGRTVAVKTLRADLARDPSFQARFRREAQSAASLNHPAIVAVYDTGEDYVDGVSIPYIVMEYVDGSTLRELLHSGRKLLPERTLEMTVGILQALEYSHRAGIVHRDIKPANVMLTRTGQVKVMDFGIARAMGDSGMTMTQTSAVIGTAQYLSPEQAKGEQVDARSDLYSTGCLLYELLTVRPPFIGDSPVAVAYQHVREEPQPPSNFDPEITPEMDAIVLKALVKDPDYRYQSADEMRADIEACLDGQPVAAAAAMGIGMGMAGAPVYGGGYGGYPPEDQPTTALHQSDPAGQTSMMPPVNPNDGGYGGYGGYDDRPDRRGRGGQKKSNTSTIMLVVAAVILLVGAVFIVVSLFDKKDKNPQVVVPQLVGQTMEGAQGLAANASVKVLQAGTERCDQPKGSICRQTPVADNIAKMDTDGTVQVYVSEGAPLLEVPDVVEQSQERAEDSLKSKGFKVKVEQEESDKDPGSVLRQNPDGGTKAEKNSEVTITVSKQKLKTVPVVVGNPVSQAEQQLKQLGFNVTTEYVDSEQPKDQVLAQTPEGNASAPQDTTVKLRVSKGPQQTQVQIPTDIGGKKFKDVKQQLEAMGLVVQQQGSGGEDDRVIGANPGAGQMVNTGDTVVVYTLGGNGPGNGGPGNNGGDNGGGNGDGGNPGGNPGFPGAGLFD